MKSKTIFAVVLADKDESEKVLAELKGVEPELWAKAWMSAGVRWESAASENKVKGQHQAAKEAYYILRLKNVWPYGTT